MGVEISEELMSTFLDVLNDEESTNRLGDLENEDD
jgi:hypothetical protein